MLIPFLIGLFAGSTIRPISSLPLLILFGFLLLLENIKLSVRWKYRKSIGLLFQLHIFLLGFTAVSFQPNIQLDTLNEQEFVIHLLEMDNRGKKYDRYISKIYPINKSQNHKSVKAYTYIAASLKNTGMGDIVLTNNKPNKIMPIYNPGGFDFSAFANREGIQYTIFLNRTEECIQLKHAENYWLSLVQHLRKWIINTLQFQLKDSSSAGLIEALMIGYKEDLDNELQEQYTLTGVAHIIAVSGMHLGLIFGVLSSFISLFGRRKLMRYMSFCLTLPFLWTFALVSGASASVLRSVLVFSIVIWGDVLLKKSGSINALLASAFILLVIKPSYIYDIGFQLSYAAVLSILIYEPIISASLFIKNKLLMQLWKVVAITLAAQILTTPLVLFHFQQFPALFLITNLVAVPLSNLILLLGILLCFVSLLTLPTTLLTFIIKGCIQWMNGYIEKIATIPFNALYIQTTLPFTIGLYGLIVLLTLYFKHKRRPIISTFFYLVFFLLLIYLIEQNQLRARKRIIVLQVKNATYVIHHHGNKAFLIISSNQQHNKPFLQKKLRSLSKALGVLEWRLLILKDQATLIALNNQKAVGQTILFSGFTDITPTIHQLVSTSINPHQLIADGSNKLWKIKQWEKQAQEVHLRLYSTPEKGALILSCEHR